MKKLISYITTVILITTLLYGCNSAKVDPSAVNKELIKANNNFAFDLYRQLNNQDKSSNIFISPISISTALTMGFQGAKGTTRDEMAAVLGYKGMDILSLNESYKNLLLYLKNEDSSVNFNISNSIWIKQGESIKQDFIEVNKKIFDTEIKNLDFSKDTAADEINKWIENATQGKIDKMVSSPIDPDVLMYIINAIYFKSDWSVPFDDKRTFSTVFHNGAGTDSQVNMMSRYGEAEYGSGEDYKAVKRPYGSRKISMYFILPSEKSNINSLISSMNQDKWNDIKSGISKKEELLVQIPKFKIEYGIKELQESLSALGMKQCFTKDADFSGIHDNIYISKVLHKAVIQLDEKGSEAAAATVVEIKLTAVEQTESFVADRPFMFIIADDTTGSILFEGTFSNAS